VTNVPPAERGISVTRSFGRMDREGLATLVSLAAAGRLHTPVAREFDVSDVRAAYQQFQQPHGRGRIVLTFT
jgi:NADPH:quinone reductase-like Zn-dependent oxidoreductase